jgi:hypothetical protein
MLGGAVFDVCVRYLHENPWRRVETLSSRLATPTDGFLRGQSLYTFELFPDDIVELNSQVLARNGLKKRHRLRRAKRQSQRRGAYRIGQSRRHDGDRRHRLHGESGAHRRVLR